MQSLDKHTALLCPRSGLGAAAPCGRCHHLTVTVSRWLQPLLLENCQASRRTSCCSGGSGAACPAPSQPAAGASAGAGNLAVESSMAKPCSTSDLMYCMAAGSSAATCSITRAAAALATVGSVERSSGGS